MITNQPPQLDGYQFTEIMGNVSDNGDDPEDGEINSLLDNNELSNSSNKVKLDKTFVDIDPN